MKRMRCSGAAALLMVWAAFTTSPVAGSPLRILPLPLLELAPGGEGTRELSWFVVPTAEVKATADSPLRVTVDGTTLRVRAGEECGLFGVEVEARRGAERNRATLPIWVRRDRFGVTLRYRPTDPATAAVAVAGDFNGWSATASPLVSTPDGSWSLRLDLPRGRSAYKLVVGGAWQPDPGNPLRVPDGFGGVNSVLVATESGGAERPALLPVALARTREGWRVTMEGRGADAPAPESLLMLVDGVRSPSARLRRAGERWAVEVPGGPGPRDVWLMALTRRGEPFGPLRWRLGGDPSADNAWPDRVLYFAMTDRFANGSASNDRPLREERVAPLNDWQGGDFAGLKRAVESGWFDRLGASALWLSPVNLAPEGASQDSLGARRWFSGYHGYWPVALHAVEPRLGTLEELRDLVRAAHDRGMAVLLDAVFHHVHEQSPLVRRHPDWFLPLRLPDGTPNVQRFDEHPLTTWFDEFLPTFAYERSPAAVEAMTANAVYWLRATGADGFRLDAVKHVPLGFWTALRSRLRTELDPERAAPSFLLGETIASRAAIAEPLAGGAMDGQFEFPLYYTLRDSLAKGTRGLDVLEADLSASETAFPDGALPSPLLGNHDFARFLAFSAGALPEGADEKALAYSAPPTEPTEPAAHRRLTLAFAFLLTTPGLPLIYYGDETGMTGAGDPDNRRMMTFEGRPWQEELRERLSRLTHARRESRALRRGQRVNLLVEPEVWIYARLHPGDVAVVALNRASAGCVRTVRAPPGLSDGAVLRDALSGRAVAASGGRLTVEVPAGEALVLLPAWGAAAGSPRTRP